MDQNAGITSKRILFIEDDAAISEMYARALARGGYSVDFAYNGTEGLARSRAEHYDLLLLDIMMPELTGMELLREFRTDPGASAGARVVILTNLAQDATSKEALRAEADGYLVKADIVPSQLVGLVDELLGGSAGA